MQLFIFLQILSALLSGTTTSYVETAQDLSLQRYEYKEYHMGVDVRMIVYAPSETVAVDACGAAFERFAELDTVMSDYRANSELMRLCAKAGGVPIQVSKDLFKVLQRSQELAQRSEGAFDVTCSPLIRLWRKARKSHIAPLSEEIAKARELVGWQKMRLNSRKRTVQLLVPDMRLDLGGIGKGYAADCAQEVLKQHGIDHALIEAGGDIVVTNPPPGQMGWRIQVANAQNASVPPILLFSNCAVSTSGDTEQSVEIGGKRYSHIINPRTGYALTDRIQVTIVAKDGLTSDGLSTAVSVLGSERGQRLVKTYRGATAHIRHLGNF